MCCNEKSVSRYRQSRIVCPLVWKIVRLLFLPHYHRESLTSKMCLEQKKRVVIERHLFWRVCRMYEHFPFEIAQKGTRSWTARSHALSCRRMMPRFSKPGRFALIIFRRLIKVLAYKSAFVSSSPSESIHCK